MNAWILHRRAYKENAALVDCLVEGYGRTTVIAYAVNSKKNRVIIQPFNLILMEYSGYGALKKLRTVELIHSIPLLDNRYFLSGCYINELLIRSIPECQTIEGLDTVYSKTMHLLAAGEPLFAVLRFFEFQLLEMSGYLPSFTEDIDGQAIKEDQYYQFMVESGFSLVNEMSINKDDYFLGETLIKMSHCDFYDQKLIYDFRKFSRLATVMLIGDKPLRSRKLFNELYGYNPSMR